jgi:hypothetical protein
VLGILSKVEKALPETGLRNRNFFQNLKVGLVLGYFALLAILFRSQLQQDCLHTLRMFESLHFAMGKGGNFGYSLVSVT